MKILVIGACGQLGTELTKALRQKYGADQVIAACQSQLAGVQLNVRDRVALAALIKKEQVTQIYHLAAMLSARGEPDSQAAWELNVAGLINVLKIAKEQELEKVFWPSSIAVFGPNSPKHGCPQESPAEPPTVYGICKRLGEYWCNYYFEKLAVDVRSLRFPGLIAYSAPAGDGTTDYAVDIFKALEVQEYSCDLKEDTCLPMMYMPDAVRATIELMAAPAENIRIRTAYNLAALSFSPCDLVAQIRRQLPGLEVSYEPDYRQFTANSAPTSLDDSLESMTADMLRRLYPEKMSPDFRQYA